MKNRAVEIILLVLLIGVSVVFAYYYGTQKGKFEEVEEPGETLLSPASSPTTIPTTNIPAGWKTYINQEYGFEISYPPSYQALTDEENLYGWPKAIVLFYGGGQSYDLAIEHWNTQVEYEDKYQNQTNLAVKKIGGTYITLLNANFEAEVDQIIATFKSL
jgi:hypothetical protein